VEVVVYKGYANAELHGNLWIPAEKDIYINRQQPEIMEEKRHEVRIMLTDKDWKIVEKLKEETGIKSNAELVRFAFTRLSQYLNRLGEDTNK